MIIETCHFRAETGWNPPPPARLDSPSTLVLAFGASALVDRPPAGRPDPIAELRAALPNAILHGCSSAGEILGGEIHDDGLAVAVVRFEHTGLRAAAVALGPEHDAERAGAELAERLLGEGLGAVLVLSDGLAVNGSALVAGLNASLPPTVVVTGGLAGDADRFARTWVLADGAPAAGRVAAVGFYGDRVRVGHGSKGGWDIFGPERRVTRSHGNVLFALDGRPALALYKEYLGELAAGLPATGLRFPLALRADADDTKRLVRTILAVDDATDSMTFAGDIPEGHLAQLMRANFEHLIDGAEEAASIAGPDGDDDGPTLAVAISCVGRRMVLGERAEEEVEATLDVLPPATRQVGFYSYGELSPYASGPCDLHNQTMTLTTIREV